MIELNIQNCIFMQIVNNDHSYNWYVLKKRSVHRFPFEFLNEKLTLQAQKFYLCPQSYYFCHLKIKVGTN